MYSKNDYRYYLEHRLAESDDYLAHYGVKGMKWKKHLKSAKNNLAETYNTVTNETELVGKKVKKGVKKVKKDAKKAYKYTDKHVDRYSYKYSVPDSRGRVSKKTGKVDQRTTYGTGVMLKTKKHNVGVAGYIGSTDRGDGKVGISVYHDNKKKRKRTYGEAGISTRYGGSYQYKRQSADY